MEVDRISLIEPHDARISVVDCFPNGRCEIQLDHLAVYVERAGRTELWSYKAQLHLSAVSRLLWEGIAETTDRVMDGRVLSQSGKELTWHELLSETPITLVDLEFSSGARLTAEAAKFTLKLRDRNRLLEANTT